MRPTSKVLAIALAVMSAAELRGQSTAQPSPSSKQSTQKKTTKRADDQPTKLLTPEEKEAQFHYKVAQTALQNNDLDVAAKELETAANLAPNNALIQYNLAVVKSKSGKPAEGLVNLKKAMDLGLPKEQAETADDLLVKLTYDSQKNGAGGLKWLKGIWTGTFPARVGYGPPYCDYAGAGYFQLTVTQDVDHPDNLTGKFTLTGNSYTFSSGSKSRCPAINGEPGSLGGQTVYSITKIQLGSPGGEEITFFGLRNSCSNQVGFDAGFNFLGCDSRIATLNIPFERVDDNHMRQSNNFPSLGVITKQ